jgi:hypothetical protein
MDGLGGGERAEPAHPGGHKIFLTAARFVPAHRWRKVPLKSGFGYVFFKSLFALPVPITGDVL